MRIPLLRVEIRFEQDVVLTRQRAKDLAELVGFAGAEQTRIATAVSEIARNAFRYAGGGTAEFWLETETPASLRVTVRDGGKGIPNLPLVLSGRYQSTTGMGMGIVGSRRLMDRFDIQSEPGKGTVVELAQILPPGVRVPGKERIAEITSELSRRSAQSPAAVLQDQNQELIRLLAEVERREAEMGRLNQELEETNRGVVALYAELDEKAEALRRASELKSRFISNVSHEFRTPLNSILSLSRLLLERVDGPLAPEQERQISFIKKSAEALAELINDLLDLAKIEAGKTDVAPRPFEVSELFATLRGMMRPLLTSDAVALIFDDAARVPPLFTDEGKLSQILRNFISNALKFTERGEVRVSVSPGVNGMITFSVTDTGVGIAPEHHARIFEEFSQVEGPHQRKAKGTGLGLSLSRRLAGLLGGTISLESALGKGSTFRLTVPAIYPQAREVPDGLELRWRQDPHATPVLVVEDDPQTRAVYDRLLDGSGFQALPARTTREARDLLTRVRPAAVVLDVQLQGEDSWELLSELKADPNLRSLPVLVITAHDVENQAVALGADAYLQKPLERVTLVGALRRFAEGGAAPARVLLVDDDEVARYLLRRMLQDERVTLIEASNGAEALARVHADRPQAVVLDLMMPGISGFEVLAQLRADPQTRELPVIIHTNKTLNAEEQSFLASAVAILSKDAVSTEQRAAQLKAALVKAGVLSAPPGLHA